MKEMIHECFVSRNDSLSQDGSRSQNSSLRKSSSLRQDVFLRKAAMFLLLALACMLSTVFSPELGAILCPDMQYCLAEEVSGGEGTAQTADGKTYISVYKGQDYSRVYDYYYYIKKYPSVARKIGTDQARVLRSFVRTGMKKGRRGCKSFSVKSYIYGNADLRKKYGNSLKKYYLHYQNKGYKSEKRRKTRTGIKKMQNPAVKYQGVSYARVYDYFWYIKQHPDVKKLYRYDDTKILEYYVKNGFPEGEKAKETVKSNAFAYINRNIFRRLLGSTQTAKKTTQIIVVIDHNLELWQKNAAGSWRRKVKAYCGYGSNGLTENHMEDVPTTPIGSYPIMFAFGIADNPGTDMTWRNITDNSYWSAERDTYNTWVESSTAIAGEHLIDYYQYKYAMAIGYNINPEIYNKGSAIFLHCKSYDHWYTAGCVSVEESVMKELLLRCKDGTYIIIVRNRDDVANY